MIPDSFLPGRGQTHHTTQEAATSTPGLLEAVDAESGVSGNHTASVLRRADDDSRCRWGNLLQRQFQHRRRRLVADGFADVDGVVGGQRPAVEWQARQVIQRRDEHQREGGGFKGASTAAAAGCIRPHHHSVQTDVAQRQPFQRFRNSLDETSSWHQLTSLLSEIERVWRMHGWIPAGWIQSWTHDKMNSGEMNQSPSIHFFFKSGSMDGWIDGWMDTLRTLSGLLQRSFQLWRRSVLSWEHDCTSDWKKASVALSLNGSAAHPLPAAPPPTSGASSSSDRFNSVSRWKPVVKKTRWAPRSVNLLLSSRRQLSSFRNASQSQRTFYFFFKPINAIVNQLLVNIN